MDAIDNESAYAEAGDIARNMAGGFLMSLFSDMEFFAGLTPGYVAGSSSIPSKSAWGDSWQYRAETWTELFALPGRRDMPELQHMEIRHQADARIPLLSD